MIIDKEQFVKTINRLRNYNDLQHNINDLFKENIDNQEMDFVNAGAICIGHETVVVELLKAMFNDTNGWINWWLWGRDYRQRCISNRCKR